MGYPLCEMSVKNVELFEPKASFRRLVNKHIAGRLGTSALIFFCFVFLYQDKKSMWGWATPKRNIQYTLKQFFVLHIFWHSQKNILSLFPLISNSIDMTTLFEYTSLLLIILIFLAIKSWLELPTCPTIWQKRKLFCNILPYGELGDTSETPRRRTEPICVLT